MNIDNFQCYCTYAELADQTYCLAFFFFFCIPQLYLWGSLSSSSAFPSYISAVHHLLLLLRSPTISLRSTIFFFFFCVPQLYLCSSPSSSSSAFLSYISGVHHLLLLLLLLRSQAISLGFTVFFIFFVPQQYLWGSPSSSSAFPSYISEAHHLLLLLLRSPAISLAFTMLGEIFAYVTIFFFLFQPLR